MLTNDNLSVMSEVQTVFQPFLVSLKICLVYCPGEWGILNHKGPDLIQINGDNYDDVFLGDDTAKKVTDLSPKIDRIWNLHRMYIMSVHSQF